MALRLEMEQIMSKTNETSRDELTIDELDAVSGGFESVEHGTLGSNPKDQQFNPDAVIDKAVGLALANIKFF
jgi:hypothetical protein